MSAQKGKDILLKIAAIGSSNFVTIGGLRTRSIALNAQTIDVSHAETEGWRELLGDAGFRSAKISGTGVFLTDAAAEEVRACFFASAIRRWQVIIPGFGQFEGPFQITALDYAGEYKSEVSVGLTLDSAGVLEFSAL